MPPPNESPAPRSWVRLILGSSALLLIPAVLALIVMAAKFRGLFLTDALDHAQIARRLASGGGFTTDSIRPLSLAFQPNAQAHPDLYHAPLHPILLSIAYRARHPSDRLTAAVGLLIWIATVFLTYIVARRGFGTGVAALATCFYASNMAMLRSAVLGLPSGLSAALVLGIVALALPPRDPSDATPEPGADRRIVALGLLAGLAAMTQYLLFFLAPAVAAHAVAARRRRWRALALFALGFAVVLIPWMIRNVRCGRSPVFSLYWYEALAGTDAFPGDTVWRTMGAAATSPFEFVFMHPLQMGRKFLASLARFWQESLQVADPIMAFLFAGALVTGRGIQAWRGRLLAAAAAILLTVVASCLLRPEPEILLAWTPILAIGAAAALTSWLTEQMDGISLRRHWDSGWVRAIFKRPDRARAGARIAAAGVVVALAAFPLIHYIWIFRPEPRVEIDETTMLQRYVPENGTVLTDLPSFVAWHGHRRAVWLCLDEREWDLLEARGARIDATYVTPQAATISPGPSSGWWWWIASPRGVYRNLAPVDTPPLRGVLRVRRADKG